MQGAHKQPEYLKLNPNGQIPVLVDGDLVLYETAAICMHLADTHPGAALAPPLGTRERAHYYKWMAWLTNTLQAMLMHYFYPERMVDDGDAAAAQQVKSHAQAKVVAHAGAAGRAAGGAGRPVAAGRALQRGRPLRLHAVPLDAWLRRPAGAQLAHIAPFLQRMLARPAVQRVFEAEALAQPWI